MQENKMIVAILSDTHHYLDPRIAELVTSCDIAIHAGDICGAKVLQALHPKSGKWVAVRGNNDALQLWAKEESAIIANIPEVAHVDLPGGILAVEHGHKHGTQQPCHASLRKAHHQARAIVYGHTHKMLCDETQLPWILNPGAAGRTRTRGGPSCLVLTATPEKWSVQSYRFNDIA